MENLEMSPCGHSNLINFWHGVKNIAEKWSLLQKMLPGRAGYPAGKERNQTLVFNLHNNQFKVDGRQYKPWDAEEDIRGSTSEYRQALARTLWRKDLTAQEVNPRVHRWDSRKLKGIGTLSTVRKQAADGRRSLPALRQMGLMLRMYKELQELNTRSPVL